MGRLTSLLKDAALFVVVLAHWVAASAILDAISSDTAAKKGVAVWILVFSGLVNLFSISRSWMFLGTGKGPPETIIGIFLEVVNITFVWGAFFTVARLFSHAEAEDPALFNQTLLQVEFQSFVEMALVSGGVGFTTLLPTTTFERLVTWLSAYVGGLLVTNMFLLSVILSRRGFWERVTDGSAEAAPTPVTTGIVFRLPQLTAAPI